MGSNEHRKSLEELLGSSKGPMSADEIRGSMGHRSIGTATVYRLLRKGVEEGLYREIALPEGPKRYELMEKPHHHHFICEECDRAFCIEGCSKEVLNLLLRRDFLLMSMTSSLEVAAPSVMR